MMLAALMQNKVICTPADHLPATGRAAWLTANNHGWHDLVKDHVHREGGRPAAV
jgi:hypothetical protein